MIPILIPFMGKVMRCPTHQPKNLLFCYGQIIFRVSKIELESWKKLFRKGSKFLLKKFNDLRIAIRFFHNYFEMTWNSTHPSNQNCPKKTHFRSQVKKEDGEAWRQKKLACPSTWTQHRFIFISAILLLTIKTTTFLPEISLVNHFIWTSYVLYWKMVLYLET